LGLVKSVARMDLESYGLNSILKHTKNDAKPWLAIFDCKFKVYQVNLYKFSGYEITKGENTKVKIKWFRYHQKNVG
jgi:hypothetical protein